MEDGSSIHKETSNYLFQRASVLYFRLSQEGVISEASEYAKKIMSRPLVGEKFQDIIIDFNGDFDLTALLKYPSKEHLISLAASSGLPQSYYFTFRRASDSLLAYGQLDAEEIENLRLELLSLNNDLSNLTRELHKKNAQLKLLNDEKNRFLGMAAHDLRSPIGVILSYTEFLHDEAEGLLAEEQIGFLKTIQGSCAFMKRLVDDFLDISAIEAGKFPLDLQPTAIGDVLTQALHIGKIQATKKHIDLKIHADDEFPRIAMDAPKIQQVITNSD